MKTISRSMDKISLLIVEDHEIYSHVLLELLRKDENLEVVAVVATAEEGLEKLSHSKFDLALVDIGLPRIDGITLVKLMREQYPDLTCIMISGYLSASHVQRALEAGAHGYLLKDNYAGILEGIWRVMNGETYVSKELGEYGLGHL